MSATPIQAPTPSKDSPSQPQANLVDIINVVAEKADPLIKVLTASLEHYQHGKERENRFRVSMAWAAIFIVAVIVGVAGSLTYLGKIDGSTFTFLLGLIVGYVLTFVRDQITGPEDS